MFILKSSYCNTRRRQQMATTLMELMLVVSIISVIAVFVVNRLIGSRVRAEYQQCRANLGELAQCMENYKSNEVFYYAAAGADGAAIPISDIFLNDPSAEKWLHHLHCPGADNVDADEYLIESTEDAFTIWCSGVANKRHKGYPRPFYSSIWGGIQPPK